MIFSARTVLGKIIHVAICLGNGQRSFLFTQGVHCAQELQLVHLELGWRDTCLCPQLPTLPAALTSLAQTLPRAGPRPPITEAFPPHTPHPALAIGVLTLCSSQGPSWGVGSQAPRQGFFFTSVAGLATQQARSGSFRARAGIQIMCVLSHV